MFKTLTLAIAVAAVIAAAAPAHAGWPLTTNGTSFNALAPNGLNPNALAPNAVEAHAALNGRVIGIELPPTTGNVIVVNPATEPALTRSVDAPGRIASHQWGCNLDSTDIIGC